MDPPFSHSKQRRPATGFAAAHPHCDCRGALPCPGFYMRRPTRCRSKHTMEQLVRGTARCRRPTPHPQDCCWRSDLLSTLPTKQSKTGTGGWRRCKSAARPAGRRSAGSGPSRCSEWSSLPTSRSLHSGMPAARWPRCCMRRPTRCRSKRTLVKPVRGTTRCRGQMTHPPRCC